jgi:Protein of unknown function (DUF2721)
MNGFSPAQAIIGAMITPALLILASGSLIATALVRLARVVDRLRKLAEVDGGAVDAKLVERHKRRALCAERAVQLFFYAVVCFVMAGFAIAIDHFAGDALVLLPVGITALGMALIVAGCAAMLTECRLATEQILLELAGQD